MENDRFPGFVDITYHSDKAPHHMEICTREWNSGIGTSGKGGFVAWNDDPIDASDMIGDLLLVILPLMPAEVEFDKYVIYKINEPGGNPLPVAGGVFAGAVGTMGTPGWFYAVQNTLTFYDTEFALGKFNLLDVGSSNQFQPRDIGSLTGAQSALVTELTNPVNAWSSRNGARLGTLRSYRFDINSKLHRQYFG